VAGSSPSLVVSEWVDGNIFGRRKRIKALYAADVLNGHIVAALVIWFEVLGGGVFSGLML
jgi:hypothetical protein